MRSYPGSFCIIRAERTVHSFNPLTFLVFPLQIQRGPVIVGGAGLVGEVPAALGVGSHHVRLGRQSWNQESPPLQQEPLDEGSDPHVDRYAETTK